MTDQREKVEEKMRQGKDSPLGALIPLDARILVTGARGMVGSVLINHLKHLGYLHLLGPSREELDLENQAAVKAYFEAVRPQYVFMLAARVGGIQANIADPVAFLSANLRIALNTLEACHQFGVQKSCFLGSSCIYPAETAQPMKEEQLLTGRLEPTNEGYALAKISGLRLAQYYARQYGLKIICPMPCNIYGTNDHFDLEKSHVLTALVRRFVDAKRKGQSEVTLWGTGIARREFIHVEDVVRGILFMMERVQHSEIINIGPGTDISIAELAEVIRAEVGYVGVIRWDSSKPDGMLRKCLDVTKLNELGFRTSIFLNEGIRQTIREYIHLTQAKE